MPASNSATSRIPTDRTTRVPIDFNHACARPGPVGATHRNHPVAGSPAGRVLRAPLRGTYGLVAYRVMPAVWVAGWTHWPAVQRRYVSPRRGPSWTPAGRLNVSRDASCTDLVLDAIEVQGPERRAIAGAPEWAGQSPESGEVRHPTDDLIGLGEERYASMSRIAVRPSITRRHGGSGEPDMGCEH